MSLSATDIVIYGSANMPETSGLTAGGAINTSIKVIFDSPTLANTLNTVVAASSTLAQDNQSVVITGRNSYGTIVTDTIVLDGLTSVNGDMTFERLMKVVVPAHQGTIAIMKGTTGDVIGTMESGVLTLRRPFYNVSSEATGGAHKDYFEKVFLQNNSTTNALLGVIVSEYSDPSTLITFAVESGVNTTTSVTDRTISPANCGPFDSYNKTIVDLDLAPGSGIPIWLKLGLDAGLAPTKTTYSLQFNGATT